ncbi:MAG TPA: hypothetical protein VF177_16985 [Anaerolineae bacterium]
MESLVPVVGAVLCALLAVRARRLLTAALWLAGASALVSVSLYGLGAHETAVIELSVGAGLVTILFVFAIATAGEEAMAAPAIVPSVLTWALVVTLLAALGWLILPAANGNVVAAETPSTFTAVLWRDRGLDVLVQIGLIFAGVLGVLGLLSEDRATEKFP